MSMYLMINVRSGQFRLKNDRKLSRSPDPLTIEVAQVTQEDCRFKKGSYMSTSESCTSDTLSVVSEGSCKVGQDHP